MAVAVGGSVSVPVAVAAASVAVGGSVGGSVALSSDPPGALLNAVGGHSLQPSAQAATVLCVYTESLP